MDEEQPQGDGERFSCGHDDVEKRGPRTKSIIASMDVVAPQALCRGERRPKQRPAERRGRQWVRLGVGLGAGLAVGLAGAFSAVARRST